MHVSPCNIQMLDEGPHGGQKGGRGERLASKEGVLTSPVATKAGGQVVTEQIKGSENRAIKTRKGEAPQSSVKNEDAVSCGL